jgi:radical SAM protein with 4Fe4S-binding SPASM domain
MIRKHFDGYNFVGIPEMGVTFRWGANPGANPVMAPWPELADISVSNYCTNGCRYCYRSSDTGGRFMPLEDFRFVLEQLTSKTYGSIFQVALGGGEPLLHPDFTAMLKLAREEYGVIPNYTTCGKYFNQSNVAATRAYCGAVAVSWDPYREDLSLQDLARLGADLKAVGVRCNIHYVVSEQTLGTATAILMGEYDEYLRPFNAVIFLTYKPLGRADGSGVIRSSAGLKKFLGMIDRPATAIKIGCDACLVPGLLKATKVDEVLIDSCECGFFSVYIDENLKVMPCSFCNDDRFKFDLRRLDFQEICQDGFAAYRSHVASTGKSGCPDCDRSMGCRGRCPFFGELFLCDLL